MALETVFPSDIRRQIAVPDDSNCLWSVPRLRTVFKWAHQAKMEDVSENGSEIESIFRVLADHGRVTFRNPLRSFTRFERLTLASSLICFNIGGGITLIARWRGDVSVKWQAIAVVSLLLALLGAIMFQALSVYQSVGLVSQPVTSFLRGQGMRAQKDYLMIQKIGTASPAALEFAAARLRSEAEHLRGRIGMIVGAVDKVGIIPLVAGWLFSGWQLVQNVRTKSTAYIDLAIAGLGVLYCLSLIMLATSYRIDELAKVAELARGQQSNSIMDSANKSAPNGRTAEGPYAASCL